MSVYTTFNTKTTKPTKPILGKNQIKNNAGGYVYSATSWETFKRFLILGSEGGTYYTQATELTEENAKNTIGCIKADGVAVVEAIREVSLKGLAPKNDAAIFALALCTAYGNADTKQYAYQSINEVCRTGTHLFAFSQHIRNMRGWSRGLCKGVANFYLSKSDDKLAYQLIKYRQREGWTHRDVIRLSHPSAKTESQNNLLKWSVGKSTIDTPLHKSILAFEILQKLGTDDISASIKIIEENKLPWEALPTELLTNKKVWETLLPTLPLHALLRNLGRLTNIGLIDGWDNTLKVTDRIWNKELITKSRLHPMTILNTLKVYSSGRGVKSSLSWSPNTKIVDSLNEAFYLSFDNVEPTNKKMLIAVDTSASMSASINGMALDAREAACAMALIYSQTEKHTQIIGFDDEVVQFTLSARQRLDDALKNIPMRGRGTNCSLPMLWAEKNKLNADAIVILTDNESWSGKMHPSQALTSYRQTMKNKTKLIASAMTATKCTIADPADSDSLNVVGFDTNSPLLISNFVKGAF